MGPLQLCQQLCFRENRSAGTAEIAYRPLFPSAASLAQISRHPSVERFQLPRRLRFAGYSNNLQQRFHRDLRISHHADWHLRHYGEARLAADSAVARDCSAFDCDDLFFCQSNSAGIDLDPGTGKCRSGPGPGRIKFDSGGARIRARRIRSLAIPPTGAWEFAGEPAPDSDHYEERTRHQRADSSRDRSDVLPRHGARSGRHPVARIAARFQRVSAHALSTA